MKAIEIKNQKLTSVIAIWILTFTISVTGISVDNFEKGVSGLSSWKKRNVKTGVLKTQLDLSVKKSGKASLCMTFKLPQGFNLYHLKKSFGPVNSKTNYTLYAQIKTKLDSGYFMLIVQDGRGHKHFCKDGAKIKGKTSWAKYKIKFTTKPDTKKIKILVRNYGGKKAQPLVGKVWVDDIVLEKK